MRLAYHAYVSRFNPAGCRLDEAGALTYSMDMVKKTKQKSFTLWTRRSYEPLKMTVAVSVSAVTLLVLFALLFGVK